MKDKIIAAGPIIKERGTLPCRVVLRVFYTAEGKPAKFVVHTQTWEDGKASFSDGNYWTCTKSAADVMQCYEDSLKVFTRRMTELATGKDFEAVFGHETAA